MQSLSLETRVADAVLDHAECANVFDRYRIDYCCKGNRSLRDACTERGVDPARVLVDCNMAIQGRQTDDGVDLRELSTKELIVKVIAKHHQYLHRTLPFIQSLTRKVSRVHGDHNPALRDIDRVTDTLSIVLLDHLFDEEHDLFPALLANNINAAMPLLMLMRREHEDVGMMLHVLRTMSEDYRSPEWACTSYRTMMSELAHLEADTMRHVHIENHVLLPRYLPQA